MYVSFSLLFSTHQAPTDALHDFPIAPTIHHVQLREMILKDLHKISTKHTLRVRITHKKNDRFMLLGWLGGEA